MTETPPGNGPRTGNESGDGTEVRAAVPRSALLRIAQSPTPPQLDQLAAWTKQQDPNSEDASTTGARRFLTRYLARHEKLATTSEEDATALTLQVQGMEAVLRAAGLQLDESQQESDASRARSEGVLPPVEPPFREQSLHLIDDSDQSGVPPEQRVQPPITTAGENPRSFPDNKLTRGLARIGRFVQTGRMQPPVTENPSPDDSPAGAETSQTGNVPTEQARPRTLDDDITDLRAQVPEEERSLFDQAILGLAEPEDQNPLRKQVLALREKVYKDDMTLIARTQNLSSEDQAKIISRRDVALQQRAQLVSGFDPI